MKNFNKKQNMDQRDSLISSLTENIVSSAVDIVKNDEDTKELKRITVNVKERLNFEASVLLNETVTKLSPAATISKLTEEPERMFQRFGVNFRAQHILMFVSCIILIITGIPLKFPTYAISKFVIIDLKDCLRACANLAQGRLDQYSLQPQQRPV